MGKTLMATADGQVAFPRLGFRDSGSQGGAGSPNFDYLPSGIQAGQMNTIVTVKTAGGPSWQINITNNSNNPFNANRISYYQGFPSPAANTLVATGGAIIPAHTGPTSGLNTTGGATTPWFFTIDGAVIYADTTWANIYVTTFILWNN